jgi:dihydropteroate synthase
VEGCEVVRASGTRVRAHDPAGYVKITIDRSRGVMVVSHFRAGRITCVVEGLRAEEVCDELIARGLVSTLDHATYVGRELYKAELALKLDKSYVQDEELDFGFSIK